MPKEPKGFKNNLGEILERTKPIATKNGVILYKGKRDDWKIEYPDDSKRIGGVTTIRLMNLIYYLNQTKGNLEKSRKLAGLE